MTGVELPPSSSRGAASAAGLSATNASVAAGPVVWDDSALRAFYQAYHKHQHSWLKVAKTVGPGKTAEQCEALYKQHTGFLNLHPSPELEAAFVALVHDHNKNRGPGPSASGTEAADDGVTSHQQLQQAANALVEGGGQLDDPMLPADDGMATNSDGAVAEAETTGRPKRTPKRKPVDDDWVMDRPEGHKRQTPSKRLLGSPDTPKSARHRASNGHHDSLMKLRLSPLPQPESSRKRRTRRLFGEEEEEAQAEPDKGLLERWRERQRQDDVGEGVDALLSLASIAHASTNLDDAPQGLEGELENHEHAQLGITPRALDGDQVPGSARARRLGAGKHSRNNAFEFSSPLKSPQSAKARLTSTSFRSPSANIRSLSRPSRPSTSAVVGSVALAGELYELAGAAASPEHETGYSSEIREAEGDPDGDAGSAGVSPLRSPAGGRARDVGQRSRRRASAAVHALIAAEAEDENEEDLLHQHAGMLISPREHTALESRPTLGRGARAAERAAAAAAAAENSEMDGQQAMYSGAGADDSVHYENSQPGGQDDGHYSQPHNNFEDVEVPAKRRVTDKTTSKVAPLPVRARKRKSGPEKAPAMQTPMKGLFARSGYAGYPSTPAMPNSMPDSFMGAMGLAANGGAPRVQYANEVGEPMGAAEISLRHCLSPRVRRWCMYEWHYSAIDRPWFMRSEMQDWLQRVGLGHVTRLTRTEWSLLRGAFGTPRRLSQNFLRDERVRLEAYRAHVRRKYEEIGVGMEVPPDLPRPLRVGQEVTARHPATHQLHDGTVLTVKGNKYRVQFNRSELMTEVVHDVEVMPTDPGDNLSAVLAASMGTPIILNGRISLGPGTGANSAARRRQQQQLLQQQHEHHRAQAMGQQQQIQQAQAAHVQRAAASVQHQSMPSAMFGLLPGPMQTQDTSILQEAQKQLKVKEQVMAELRMLNNQAQSGMHQDEHGKQTEAFQLQYTNVVLHLKAVNESVDEALKRVTNRSQQVNTSMEAPAPPAAATAAAAQSAQHAQPHDGVVGDTLTAGASSNTEGQAQVADDSGTGGAEGGDGAIPGGDGADTHAAGASNSGGGASTPNTMAAASAVVQRALAETADVLQVSRMQLEMPAPGAVPMTTATGGRPSAASDATYLHELVSQCVGMLLTVQAVTAADAAMEPGVLEGALELAVKALHPHCEASLKVYDDILKNAQQLKGHLTAAAL